MDRGGNCTFYSVDDSGALCSKQDDYLKHSRSPRQDFKTFKTTSSLSTYLATRYVESTPWRVFDDWAFPEKGGGFGPILVRPCRGLRA